MNFVAFLLFKKRLLNLHCLENWTKVDKVVKNYVQNLDDYRQAYPSIVHHMFNFGGGDKDFVKSCWSSLLSFLVNLYSTNGSIFVQDGLYSQCRTLIKPKALEHASSEATSIDLVASSYAKLDEPKLVTKVEAIIVLDIILYKLVHKGNQNLFLDTKTKRPSIFRGSQKAFIDMVEKWSLEDQKCKAMIHQLLTYMVNHGIRYGVLSSTDNLFFTSYIRPR